MGSPRRFVLVILLLLAVRGLHAETPSPERVDALMALSGLQNTLASLPQELEQAILQPDSGLDPKRVAQLRTAMATAFANDRLQARAREFLQTSVVPEDVEQVTTWYSSALGSTIRDLELKSGDPQTYASIQGDLAKIVGVERLQRIQRIESAVEGTEAIFVWRKHAGTSIPKIRLLLWGVDPAIAVDPTKRNEEEKPTVERIAILTRADALRGLSLEELDRYVSFVESPAARHWHHAMWDALDLVMAKATEEVMAAMVSTLQPLQVGEGVTRPEKISGGPPPYPEAARRARVQGIVILEVIIDEAGNVSSGRILQGLPKGLDQAALSTIKTWKFKPATFQGRPVKVYYTLTVGFHM